MERSIQHLTAIQEHTYLPQFFRLQSADDRTEFERLKKEEPRLVVHDQIVAQVEELVKGRNPKTTFTKEALRKAALAFLGNAPREEYGIWVYYPWSGSLVHFLNKDEFIEVRTNRNRNKITNEESAKLANVKIGVIGLSVGQSIAVTMAMERSFGEIRLADFDVLELSNLNRIRVGMDQLGLKKVVAVAREIAEIDPFLKVKCYTQGLTRENMDEFFLDGGKLSIVVDECDGLDIKILARHKARDLGVPLVQDMSDRGTIDIERFDLEPDRPIMHGLIDHLDIDLKEIANLSNEDKVPYLLPMIGAETISTRLRASMLEVGQTLSTWPQLASAVALGGGLAADVCRRIALDQLHVSGRFHVDLEELIADKDQVGLEEDRPEESAFNIDENLLKGPALDELMKELQATPTYSTQLALDEKTLKELVRAAIHAPSGGNSQPWRWVYKDKFLFLYHDEMRSESFLDFQKNASYLAFGACTENLILQANAMDLDIGMRYEPCENKNLVAVFSFFKKGIVDKKEVLACVGVERAQHIFSRETNRNIGDHSPLSDQQITAVKNAVSEMPGYQLELITDQTKIRELGSIIAKVDRILITNQHSHKDFFKEIRWSKEEAESTRNGVDINTLDITPSEYAGLHIARNWKVVKYLNMWKGGTAFEKLTRKSIDQASALGVITNTEHTHASYFGGGRAMQKMWLESDRLSLSLQPHFSPVCMFSRIAYGANTGLTDGMLKELLPLREAYQRILETTQNNNELFLFRLGKAERPTVRSYRHPVEEMLNL